MHIKAENLNIFAAACVFDAANTQAGRLFEYLEQLEIDAGTVMVVMSKVRGRRRFCSSRRDGRWLMFDMADGSVLAYCPWGRVVAGEPWLWAVESRVSAEIVLQERVWSMDHCFWANEGVATDDLSMVSDDHHQGVVLAAAG